MLLNKIFLDGAYANIALAQVLSDVSLPDQDRRFLTELVYGTVKAKGTLDWYIAKVANKALRKIDGRVLNALRLGAYQIFYLDKVPVSAACNETVELVKGFGHTGMVNFTNGVMRSLARDKDTLTFPPRETNEPLWVALTYQHPLWLVERWHYRYGIEDAIKICEFDNKQPKFSFRVNTLKTSRNGLKAKMQAAGYEVEDSKWSKEGLIGTKMGSTAELMREFGKLIYIQDESSMLVADILNPQPGETVLDSVQRPRWQDHSSGPEDGQPWADYCRGYLRAQAGFD
jgi:16S rRNA (cytosine967-C5)-methyltransferase